MEGLKKDERYAETQFDIGYINSELATYKGLEKRELLVKAIKAYEKALTVYTKDTHPLQYAATQNNLGTAYRTLSEVENKAENCKKAIKAYEKALEIVRDMPELYKQISINLEIAKKECS